MQLQRTAKIVKMLNKFVVTVNRLYCQLSVTANQTKMTAVRQPHKVT